jgi:periplasmic protein TonB
MFEDSTFESTGRIRTRSRGWMVAALAFNGSILTAMILVPLIYPEALPSHAFAFLMAVPPPPPSPPPVAHQAASAASASSPALQDPLAAPRQIPYTITIIHDPGPAPTGPISTLDPGTGIPYGMGDSFPPQPPPRVVRAAPSGPLHISSGVATSIAIYKPIPVYPALARAARVEGTVVPEATISKQGTIEDLRVVSGPAMLRQAALDAVSQWRYRPYLLNGDPVAVETTVNVVFNLQR